MSLLLLSILYMASLGLVCPSEVWAVGTPSGSVIVMGGDGGSANVVDQPGDIVASAVTSLGNDTAFLTTNPNGVTQTASTAVSAVYGDTLSSLTPTASALPGDTAVIDLVVSNLGNATDIIVFDTLGPPMPTFDVSGPLANQAKITFWNGPGTTEISNISVPAAGSASFKIKVYFSASALQGDTLRFTLKAKANNGAGGEPGGYIGNNGVAYAGKGDDTAAVVAVSGAVSTSDATRIAFTGDTHILASGGSVTITVVVRNDTGIVVPNAQVNFTVTNPTADPGAGLSTTNPQNTNASGQASTTLTLGTASSYYRVKAQVVSTGAFQNFYAYNDKLNIPGLDTSPANLGKGWRMWSANKNPPPSPNVTSVIQGPPGTLGTGNPATVYEWQAVASPNAALNNTKYYAPSSIVRGRAYWVKDQEGGLLEVSGPADTNVTVYDTLVGKGWHQIGSGQFFFVDWANSVQFARSADSPQTFFPPPSAAISGWIKNAIYWRDDVNNNYIFGPDTALLTQVQMKPMAGFWLWVDTDAVVMKISPTPTAPIETATAILNQSPKYLSANFQQKGQSGNDANWAIQLIAQSAAGKDMQNYIGVMPTAEVANRSSLYEPPSVANGYMTLGIRDPDAVASPLSAAAYAAPVTTAKSWNVEVYTDVNSPVTLSWDNVSSIPEKYTAYLVTPGGPVDLRKASTYQMPAFSGKQSLTFAVGLPEYLGGFLAAPLAEDVTFVYPNPGPDAAGLMNFKHNVTSGDVKLTIYDMGGKLVRELTGTTSPIQWDTTNRFGQKVASGVYIYILESGGTKLVDKLAVVR